MARWSVSPDILFHNITTHWSCHCTVTNKEPFVFLKEESSEGKSVLICFSLHHCNSIIFKVHQSQHIKRNVDGTTSAAIPSYEFYELPGYDGNCSVVIGNWACEKLGSWNDESTRNLETAFHPKLWMKYTGSVYFVNHLWWYNTRTILNRLIW